MIPYGSLVVYVTLKGRRYVRRLEQGQDWHSSDGGLPAERVAALDFGALTRTSLGVPILVQEATLFDRLLHVKRQTQIIYPKDIAYICLRLGAGPGRIILEAGCGSGALTMGLSWFCGPTGKVVSHEAREEFLRLTRRNLDWAGLGDNVEIHCGDIAEGFARSDADALFLDVRTPWNYLGHAAAALRPGAVLGFLLPTADQVSRLLLGFEQGPFSDAEVCELLLRRWKPVPDRLRPEDRMIAHTGFLVFCRLQEGGREFAAAGNSGTRGRKREAARRGRALRIRKGMPADNPVLIALWRRAVTVSHTFLTEGNIESIETDVAAALPVLEIWVCESEKGVPLGFMGLKGAKVEMLFVEPASFGSGIGTGLLNYARQLHDTLTLDVNEQNSRAHDFYLRCGFRETGRSTLDAAGRPFPLIHMELNP